MTRTAVNPIRWMLWATWLVAALLAALSPARAIEQGPFGMEILVDGQPLSEYQARGRAYVEALAGREYSVRLSNHTGGRVAIALAVDGLNWIDAKSGAADEGSKWILGPYEVITIDGWQTSSSNARRFYFTTETASYGAWLGETPATSAWSPRRFSASVCRWRSGSCPACRAVTPRPSLKAHPRRPPPSRSSARRRPATARMRRVPKWSHRKGFRMTWRRPASDARSITGSSVCASTPSPGRPPPCPSATNTETPSSSSASCRCLATRSKAGWRGATTRGDSANPVSRRTPTAAPPAAEACRSNRGQVLK